MQIVIQQKTFHNLPTGEFNVPPIVTPQQDTSLLYAGEYFAPAPQIMASAIDNPYMFTGRRLDAESGLYYYRFRYYNPDIGRFLQTDPLDYIDGLNMYTYVGNSSINRIDPYGKAWSWAGGAVGAGVGALGGFTGGVVHEAIDWGCGGDFSWGDVGTATAGGAAAGFVGGAAFGAATGDPSALAAAAIVTGAVGGGVTGALDNLPDENNPDGILNPGIPDPDDVPFPQDDGGNIDSRSS